MIRTIAEIEEAFRASPMVALTPDEKALWNSCCSIEKASNRDVKAPPITRTFQQLVQEAEAGTLTSMTREESELWFETIKDRDNKKDSIAEVLAERGYRYGPFAGHARITQAIKDTIKSSPKWDDLTWSQREALEMIAHKIGRILNGDPNYLDSWVDIVGYTQLVIDELNAVNAKEKAK